MPLVMVKFMCFFKTLKEDDILSSGHNHFIIAGEEGYFGSYFSATFPDRQNPVPTSIRKWGKFKRWQLTSAYFALSFTHKYLIADNFTTTVSIPDSAWKFAQNSCLVNTICIWRHNILKVSSFSKQFPQNIFNL